MCLVFFSKIQVSFGIVLAQCRLGVRKTWTAHAGHEHPHRINREKARREHNVEIRRIHRILDLVEGKCPVGIFGLVDAGCTSGGNQYLSVVETLGLCTRR